MSFTLKLDSASCGSGLDGTENVMSWSDTFSSFYQGDKKKNTSLNYLLKQQISFLPLHQKFSIAAACVQCPGQGHATDTYI